jgi:cell shape-determining protein MreC
MCNDYSIPQTRALTTQRAYRARKAQYLQDLEERCQVAETENARLRAELAVARADAETSATVRERHAVSKLSFFFSYS